MEQTEPITLYELDGCPYCAKVITTLNELNLDYESIMVESAHSQRTKVEELTGGPTGVPVIVDPNTDKFNWLNESDDIIDYLEQTYGNNE